VHGVIVPERGHTQVYRYMEICNLNVIIVL